MSNLSLKTSKAFLPGSQSMYPANVIVHSMSHPAFNQTRVWGEVWCLFLVLSYRDIAHRDKRKATATVRTQWSKYFPFSTAVISPTHDAPHSLNGRARWHLTLRRSPFFGGQTFPRTTHGKHDNGRSSCCRQLQIPMFVVHFLARCKTSMNRNLTWLSTSPA